MGYGDQPGDAGYDLFHAPADQRNDGTMGPARPGEGDVIDPGANRDVEAGWLGGTLGIESEYNRTHADPRLFQWQGPKQSTLEDRRNQAMNQAAPALDKNAGMGEYNHFMGGVGKQNQTIGKQDDLAGYFSDLRTGKADSAAQRQMQMGQQANLNAALAQARSGKGSQLGAARYNQQRTSAESNAQFNQQMGLLRSQEAQQAAAAEAGVYANQNQTLTQQQQNFLNARGQTQDMERYGADLQMRQNTLNQQMGLAYSGQQIQTGQAQADLSKAQAEDWQKTQQGNAEASQKNAEASGGLLGGALGAVGGALAMFSDASMKMGISPAGASARSGPSNPYDYGDGAGGNSLFSLMSDPHTKEEIVPAGGQTSIPDASTSAPSTTATGGDEWLDSYMKTQNAGDTPYDSPYAETGYSGGVETVDPYSLNSHSKSGQPGSAAAIDAANKKAEADRRARMAAIGNVGGSGMQKGMTQFGMGLGSALAGSGDSGASGTAAVAGSGGAGAGGGDIIRENPYSDRRVKTLVVPGGRSTTADEFLDALSKSASTFKYKDPTMEPVPNPTGGRYLGVMAQEVAKTPTGDTLVRKTPRGLQLNVAPNLSAALAGLGRLNERLEAVEDALPRKGKKKAKR